MLKESTSTLKSHLSSCYVYMNKNKIEKLITNLKSIMALAINFPKKRNFILILAMCAGLVVLPKGTANSPLELNIYFIPSWFPDEE